MAERTSYQAGTFSWIDLATTDQDAAKLFYSKLMGWEFRDVDVGEGRFYTMFEYQGKAVAACSTLQPALAQAGVPPHWSSYVTVDDCDATVAEIQSAGGKISAPSFDVFDAGRMAVAQDLEGATFCIWQPKEHIGAKWVNHPGGFCWNELLTKDIGKAKSFYESVFGWKIEKSQSPGEYYEIKNGERMNGGMLPATPEMGPIPPNWGIYLSVNNIEDSVAKLKELGGQTVMDPVQIPVGTFCVSKDPQGAHFTVMQLSMIDD